MTSTAELAAFSNICGLEPGTASSERLSRGWHCSTMVKLIGILLAPWILI